MKFLHFVYQTKTSIVRKCKIQASLCNSNNINNNVDLLQVSLAGKTGEGIKARESLAVFPSPVFSVRERLAASPTLMRITNQQRFKSNTRLFIRNFEFGPVLRVFKNDQDFSTKEFQMSFIGAVTIFKITTCTVLSIPKQFF